MTADLFKTDSECVLLMYEWKLEMEIEHPVRFPRHRLAVWKNILLKRQIHIDKFKLLHIIKHLQFLSNLRRYNFKELIA